MNTNNGLVRNIETASTLPVFRNSEDVTYQTHFVYEIPEFPGHKITIVGSPNIGNIKNKSPGCRIRN